MRHVLHLMKPARPGGRGGDEGGPTGHDETGRGVAPKDTPHDASELNQVAVGRDFLIVQMPDARYVGRVPSLFAQVTASAWVLNVFRTRSPCSSTT